MLPSDENTPRGQQRDFHRELPASKFRLVRQYIYCGLFHRCTLSTAPMYFSLANVPSPLIGVPSFLIFRAFRRYNSELWLEDIPRYAKVFVALADRDEIVNTPRIDRAIDLHTSRGASSRRGVHGTGGARSWKKSSGGSRATRPASPIPEGGPTFVVRW